MIIYRSPESVINILFENLAIGSRSSINFMNGDNVSLNINDDGEKINIRVNALKRLEWDSQLGCILVTI